MCHRCRFEDWKKVSKYSLKQELILKSFGIKNTNVILLMFLNSGEFYNWFKDLQTLWKIWKRSKDTLRKLGKFLLKIYYLTSQKSLLMDLKSKKQKHGNNSQITSFGHWLIRKKLFLEIMSNSNYMRGKVRGLDLSYDSEVLICWK